MLVLLAFPCGILFSLRCERVTGWLVLGAPHSFSSVQRCSLSNGVEGQMGLFLFFFFFFFAKNFTALIPGTTVEILHGDSKNIIQLIINAYNVSHRFPPPHPTPPPPFSPSEASGADVDSGGQHTMLACLALLPVSWHLLLIQVRGGEGHPA